MADSCQVEAAAVLPALRLGDFRLTPQASQAIQTLLGMPGLGGSVHGHQAENST